MRRLDSTPTRTPTRTTRRDGHHAGGWNLIELLVVVAIIVILLAIIVNTATERTGPIEQTKSIVNNAKNVYEEYFSSTGTPIDHTTNPTNGPQFSGQSAEIQRFVYKVKQNKAAFDMLMTLGGEAVGEYRSDVEQISDAWGNPLKYGYNVKHEDAYTDDDMLPQTQNEAIFGSAGPDGRWGTFNDNQPNQDAQDNIYSELGMN